MNQYIIIIVLFVTTLCLFCVTIYNRIKTKRLMKSLDEMLEEAIDGKFTEKEIDESMLSSFENKMAKYLSQSAISAQNIAEEKKELKSLISDISHQTKTPLSNIILYSELLEGEREWNDVSRENLMLLQEQTKKLEFLIRALVKMSRLETGILKLTPKKQPIANLISEVEKEYIGLAGEKGIYIKIEEECANNKYGKIAVFDYRWTLEALGNVVQNAVKYTNEGGIHLRIVPYEIYTCIEVEDTGIGIEQEEITKVFSRFYRGSNVNDESGVGIGLYLARKILSEENGYIKVTSKKGEGSKFGLYLPNS